MRRVEIFKRRKTIVWFFTICLILFILTNPIVWMLVGSNYFRTKIIEELVQETLASNLTRGLESETHKALALFEFVDTHIFHYQRLPKSMLNTSFLPYFIPGEAFCDEQALALMDLSDKVNITASVIYLRGWDEISHHSVCGMYLEGAFRIFDPDYGYIFYDGDKIATFHDIQQKDNVWAEKLDAQKALNKTFDEQDYFRLYEPTFDYVVSNRNDKFHLGRMIREGIIKCYYSLFGNPFLVYLEDLYFRLSDTHPLLSARIEHLSGRFDAALRDYASAIEELKDPFLKSKALFFRAQLFWDRGDYRKSISEFKNLLKLFPQHKNREEIMFYLGNSYEQLSYYKPAVTYYLSISDSHNTPAPTRLFKLLNEYSTLGKLHNFPTG